MSTPGNTLFLWLEGPQACDKSLWTLPQSSLADTPFLGLDRLLACSLWLHSRRGRWREICTRCWFVIYKWWISHIYIYPPFYYDIKNCVPLVVDSIPMMRFGLLLKRGCFTLGAFFVFVVHHQCSMKIAQKWNKFTMFESTRSWMKFQKH